MSLLHHYQKFISTFAGFSFVGVIVTLISMLLIFICNEILGWNSIISYLFSYTISILLSYILNAKYVWKSEFSFAAMVRYYGIYIASMLLGAVLLWLFEMALPEVNKTLLSYCVIPFTMLWNYFFVNRLLSK